MKIQNSSVVMTSSHQETTFSYKESMTMETAKSSDAVGAILNLSQEGNKKSVKEAMVDYKKQEKAAEKKRQQENQTGMMKKMSEQMRAEKKGNQYTIPDDIDMKIKMLKQILAALRGEKLPKDCEAKPDANSNVTDLRSVRLKEFESASFAVASKASVSASNDYNGQIGTNRFGTTWQTITATSGFTSETESTTFATKAFVQTEEGKSIEFDLEVSMSRAFMQETNFLEVKDYIKTDPLMINLETNIGTVSDQKFFFDLDADGKEERISFAGKGSGFLALDKNGDKIINDGSELFGTKSGDGFKDLAVYDEDGNGWIDENDSVYSRLKIWTKDDLGKDYLIDLKKADVGAIYLNNADTQFSLKDAGNNLQAEIKKTGIYLKESKGVVGTLNHVELVV